jgi:opacity protein-like surface antigen
MRNVLLSAAMVVGLASAASAQDYLVIDPATLPVVTDLDADPAPEMLAPGGIGFGIRAGYLTMKDADEGTWFGGIQARFPVGDMFAIEGSIEYHSTDFEDGDIELIQWPVHATFLWFIMPKSQICPYLLAGLSWWYSTVDFSGSLDGIDGETTNMFGAHLGGGVKFGPLSADLRYHFVEPNEDNLEDEEFDSFQIVLSYTFGL